MHLFKNIFQTHEKMSMPQGRNFKKFAFLAIKQFSLPKTQARNQDF